MMDKRFKVSGYDKKTFDERIRNYISDGYNIVGKIHSQINDFDGNARYTAVLERKVSTVNAVL